MKILNWLSGLFRSRDKPQNYYHYGDFPFFFGKTVSGKKVDEITAMQTSAVYACVRILAESVAALPLHVYRYTKDGGKERAVNHPLFPILHDAPNPEMTSFNFRESLMVHLLLRGNGYSQIIRNSLGQVTGLYPLLSDKMSVDRNDDGEIEYTYRTTKDENPNVKTGQVIFKRQDILHIPGLGFNGLVGYSPIAMMKNAVGMTIACEEFGSSFFSNGARPGGVLEHPGLIKNPDKLRESWQATYGGSSNAGKVAILEEGMKYQQIGIPPEDAQFLETRKFQTNEIARIFRVPPHLIGDLEKATFSNIEQQSLEFVKFTLNPWIVRWEQALCKALLSPSEVGKYFIKFNVDGLMRGDYQSRMQGYSIGRQNGWFSANDIREMEDMNPIPDEEGGNLYLINGNMTRLQDAGIFANKAGDKDER